jgi:hypothetical protein
MATRYLFKKIVLDGKEILIPARSEQTSKSHLP